ncbi:MAG: hypothetical protein HRU20_17125 [Pseudomonadales bacterium]|nr:hypothetical protein [Pseudomonadales bacterium]
MKTIITLMVMIYVTLCYQAQAASKDTENANNSDKKCTNDQGLTVNGIGIGSPISEVKKIFGEPMKSGKEDIPLLKNGKYYYYEGIKYLTWASDMVWQIRLTDKNVVTESGLALLMSTDEVEDNLKVKIAKKYLYNTDGTYKIPICWKSGDDLEGAVFIKFDEKERLVKLYIQYLQP